MVSVKDDVFIFETSNYYLALIRSCVSSFPQRRVESHVRVSFLMVISEKRGWAL